jgi:transposase
MRHGLSDPEWQTIKPFLPSKPRGVPRVDDRRVIDGILWVLSTGAPWRDPSNGPSPPDGCAFLIRPLTVTTAP